MTPTYTITEVLNLIAGATAIELASMVKVVMEESPAYNSHELAVIADQVSARRRALETGAGPLSKTFKNS